MQDMDFSSASLDDTVVITLRRCGHFLHHSAGKDSGKTAAELLSVLSDEEKKTLVDLLGKCLESWQE